MKKAGLDGQGAAFHAFRAACGSLLHDSGKSDREVQEWLRHAQLTTTMNTYVHGVRDLAGAEVWEDILPAR